MLPTTSISEKSPVMDFCNSYVTIVGTSKFASFHVKRSPKLPEAAVVKIYSFKNEFEKVNSSGA